MNACTIIQGCKTVTLLEIGIYKLAVCEIFTLWQERHLFPAGLKRQGTLQCFIVHYNCFVSCNNSKVPLYL